MGRAHRVAAAAPAEDLDAAVSLGGIVACQEGAAVGGEAVEGPAGRGPRQPPARPAAARGEAVAAGGVARASAPAVRRRSQAVRRPTVRIAAGVRATQRQEGGRAGAPARVSRGERAGDGTARSRCRSRRFAARALLVRGRRRLWPWRRTGSAGRRREWAGAVRRRDGVVRRDRGAFWLKAGLNRYPPCSTEGPFTATPKKGRSRA